MSNLTSLQTEPRQIFCREGLRLSRTRGAVSFSSVLPIMVPSRASTPAMPEGGSIGGWMGGSIELTEIFKGPLHMMLQDALSHIRSLIIEEKVIKYPDRPEADRFFNYPFAAIEEVLCNAVYHRSYEIREPVEVRILPDAITVGSFPGPDRSIRDQDIHELRFVSRRLPQPPGG